MVTYFVVQSFTRGNRGALLADIPVQATGADHALRLAERLASTKVGVVAFSRAGDLSTGEFEDATILFIGGDLPSDVQDVMAA
ncbi:MULTISPECIES: hypothetical protein [unclassified Ensifer]|uniref:hypothetical protein n=1 Tax=unclassified Ensifer TaxID=2633371 RepID=UPI000813A79E|nr:MULTISPECIES: hypothetical protein [unclassified Ensifer]OCP17786.1 hypothetical protein BC361_10275 [Ensifer sp. LC54]OCP28308.1 hypothetical protein BC363_00090 [Ensifer sp. LC384]